MICFLSPIPVWSWAVSREVSSSLMSRLKRQPETVPIPEPPQWNPAWPWPYVLAVLLLPVLVLWRQDNALFTGVGYLDPWFYLGFFRNLANFKGSAFPFTYYGSRLSWILPGALVHSLFSPLAANCILHLAVQSVATVSLFTTLRIAAGARRAFLATMVFSVNPWLWSATGWDYVDGVGIAYCLLTMAGGRHGARRDGLLEPVLGRAGAPLAAVLHRPRLDVAPHAGDPLVSFLMSVVWSGMRRRDGGVRRHQLSARRPFLVLCPFGIDQKWPSSR